MTCTPPCKFEFCWYVFSYRIILHASTKLLTKLDIFFICIGYALVHGQTMVKGRAVFMLAIVMKQLNKREW